MKFTDVAVSFRELCEPRYLRLSDPAKALHIAMKAWAADQQTDGVVPHVALQLIPGGHNQEAIADLVDVGLWWSTDGGVRTDWAGQILAADARDITARNRRRWSDLKRHQRGRHGPWCPKSCPKSSTDRAVDSDRDLPRDGDEDSSTTVPYLTGPDRTDPPGIGEGGFGKRRSGARLVEAAALTPPRKGQPKKQDPQLVDDLALISALRATYVIDPSPLRKGQVARLRELLPPRSVAAEDIVHVLQFALTFPGQQLSEIGSGVGAAIIAAAELLGAAGFPARWVQAAAHIRATGSARGVASSQVRAEPAP